MQISYKGFETNETSWTPLIIDYYYCLNDTSIIGTNMFAKTNLFSIDIEPNNIQSFYIATRNA